MESVIGIIENLVSPSRNSSKSNDGKEEESGNKRDLSFSSTDSEHSSPHAKKKKTEDESENRLMEDVKAMSKLLMMPIGANKSVNNEIKKLIGCYNPTLRECPDQITEMMIKVSESFSERKKAYHQAIFLVADEERVNILKPKLLNDEYDCDQLSNILTAEITNRMSNLCYDCETYYTINLNEEIKIRCTKCGVGKHMCDNNKDEIIIQHDDIYWFCGDCKQLFLEEYIKKIDRSANFLGFKQTPTINNGENESNKAKKDEVKNSNDVKNKPNKDEIIEIPDNNQTKKDQKKENDRKQEEIQECKFWESKGRCNYGEICRYKHSNKCQNIMNNGDCEENNCKKKHPEVCYNMQYYGQCDRDDCKFVHQKNSNRKQRKSTKHKNYSPNYNSYNNNYNNHHDQDWYNNDFFGYNPNQWNMGKQMRAQNMRAPPYQMFSQPWQYPYRYPPMY